MPEKITQQEFIDRANKKHNNKYDYSQVKYEGVNIKVIIRCPHHGNFMQTPNGHLSGRGCAKCTHVVSKPKQYG